MLIEKTKLHNLWMYSFYSFSFWVIMQPSVDLSFCLFFSQSPSKIWLTDCIWNAPFLKMMINNNQVTNITICIMYNYMNDHEIFWRTLIFIPLFRWPYILRQLDEPFWIAHSIHVYYQYDWERIDQISKHLLSISFNKTIVFDKWTYISDVR